jgi:hypothetical protein
MIYEAQIPLYVEYYYSNTGIAYQVSSFISATVRCPYPRAQTLVCRCVDGPAVPLTKILCLFQSVTDTTERLFVVLEILSSGMEKLYIS